MKTVNTFEEILDVINSEINLISYSRYEPQSLFDPISYTLTMGGKRVRPALVLIACNMFGHAIDKAMPVALGVEMFHNFTLLHDDLMDRADVRRGKPTVHKKWSDNVAILSGDAMLIESYKELAKLNAKYLPRILDIFLDMSTAICCGQQWDMEFEGRMDVTQEEYITMIMNKTAILLGCSLQMGALVADADEKDAKLLYDFGVNIGLAFQLKDDLLDVYGDAETFGKRIGGDILCNKKTFLLINALADQASKDEIIGWINKKEYQEEDKIKAVTTIYNRLGLKQKSELLIDDYYHKAMRSLKVVTLNEEQKQILYALAENLLTRQS